MRIATLQKASLAVLFWFTCLEFTQSWVVGAIWPPQRRIAATLAGELGEDVCPPLPFWAHFIILAVASAVTGFLVFLYSMRDKRPTGKFAID